MTPRNYRRFFRHLFFILFAFSFCSSLFAQNLNDGIRLAFPGTGSSVRALGMGNAYVGISDDGTGANFNPAGLALVKRMEISGGLENDHFTNNSTFFDNVSEYSTSSTRLNNFNVVFPFPTLQGSLSFGVTYYSTKNFNSSVDFDGFNPSNNSMIQSLLNTEVPFQLYLTDDNYNTLINGNLNQSGTVLQKGSLDNWGFSVATEVYPNLFLGGTLNIASGTWNYNRDYFEDDTRNVYTGQEMAPGFPFSSDFTTFNLNSVLNWDISGYELNFGMLYQLEKVARIGFSVQLPRVYTIKEQFDVTGYSAWGDGTVKSLDASLYSDEVQYDISTPLSFTGGASINYMGLILSASANLIDYTQIEFSDPDGITPQDVAAINKDIKDNLRSVVDFNAGFEYTVPEIFVRIRGGYFTQQSPYKNDASEYNRSFLTGGIGFLIDYTVSIDLAYVHGWWKDIGDNYGSGVSRTFQDISYDKLIFGISYRY